MSLTDLASLGSFVSGVTVLISLIYLALQVRQAEKNDRDHQPACPVSGLYTPRCRQSVAIVMR